MTIREWTKQHNKRLQHAAIWAGIGVAFSALFFMLLLAGFNGHYVTLRSLPLRKAWQYLTAHQRSVIAFHRLEIIWPLVCIITLVMAVRELIRPSPESGTYAVSFWPRMVLIVVMLSFYIFFSIAMLLTVGNFPSGQNLLTGFPNQTFDRIFMRNGHIDRHIALAVSLWMALWIGVMIWITIFVIRDIRRHIRGNASQENNIPDTRERKKSNAHDGK